jgi:transcription elongation factor
MITQTDAQHLIDQAWGMPGILLQTAGSWQTLLDQRSGKSVNVQWGRNELSRSEADFLNLDIAPALEALRNAINGP